MNKINRMHHVMHPIIYKYQTYIINLNRMTEPIQKKILFKGGIRDERI